LIKDFIKLKMETSRVYLLTNQQYARRFALIGLVGALGALTSLGMQFYVADRESRFRAEYAHLRTDPNFFHTQHEKVAKEFSVKE
jgi:hypothetical protein